MSEIVKVSDAIAEFLKLKGIRHVFGIIGAANSHIFDSIYRLGYTQIVCVHHEQAATMAIQTYYRITGKISAALVTAGGGSSNAITGVLSAWADSLPGIVISGQENTRYIKSMQNMRMWGIQGYDSTYMVNKITKYTSRVMEPSKAIYELEKAYYIAGHRRPGPVWVDYPMDIQGSMISVDKIAHFDIPNNELVVVPDSTINIVLEMIKQAKRPVFWFGHGIRLSGAQEKLRPLLVRFPFPSLVSWAGLDLLDDEHPLNFGRVGVYGNRAANFVIQNSDLVIAIGNRMTILMIGYEHSEFAREAKIVQVDIDQLELDKTRDMVDLSVLSDAGSFIEKLLSVEDQSVFGVYEIQDWIKACNGYRERYPYVDSQHLDENGFINSYRFIDRLSNYFTENQIITTDMGTALLSGHQAIRLRGKQRLMTSTGLGEMGYGLPAAIGASFASNKGEVICLNCDGGIMMNLQELQTITYHRLPIKLFIFNNDGYLMIKHTQKNLFQGRYSASNKNSGVACPDFEKISFAFQIPYYSIKTWEDFDYVIPQIQSSDGPVICEVFMDPEQYFYPKLSIEVCQDGTLISPALEDLSPLLSRNQLKVEMIIGLHPKSENLK